MTWRRCSRDWLAAGNCCSSSPVPSTHGDAHRSDAWSDTAWPCFSFRGFCWQTHQQLFTVYRLGRIAVSSHESLRDL
jgi:hypothetical protein